jgi:hypothetical protein
LDEERAALVDDGFAGSDLSERHQLATGMALFHGFSKLLITLGLEPEEMATTIVRTPDVPS